MEKKLDLKRFVIDVLSFSAKNFFLLLIFGGALFLASFLSFKYAFKHHSTMLCLYGLFSYLFYYVFINLYYNQKPVFTSEKIVNSVIKMLVIFALSLSVIIVCRLFLKLLKNMAHWLVGFPDLYEFLRTSYNFLQGSLLGQFLLLVPLVFFLTFTFFIPACAWISAINGNDASLWSAYAKTHGNYLKIMACLFGLFALLPLLTSLIGTQTPLWLGASHAVVSMIRLVFYVKLYDFFYEQ